MTSKSTTSTYSDDDLALRFSERHPELRYVASEREWFEGVASITSDQALGYVRIVCREAASEICDDNPALARHLLSLRTAKAVLWMARCDRRHARSWEEYRAEYRAEFERLVMAGQSRAHSES